jgi:hypothetical protein
MRHTVSEMKPESDKWNCRSLSWGYGGGAGETTPLSANKNSSCCPHILDLATGGSLLLKVRIAWKGLVHSKERCRTLSPNDAWLGALVGHGTYQSITHARHSHSPDKLKVVIGAPSVQKKLI